MSDSIYRHDAIKAIETSRFLIDAIEKVMMLPSTEPKTGKWVYGSPVTVKCNQCGFYIPDWEAHSSRFCRNCGAMMKEGEDHD